MSWSGYIPGSLVQPDLVEALDPLAENDEDTFEFWIGDDDDLESLLDELFGDDEDDEL